MPATTKYPRSFTTLFSDSQDARLTEISEKLGIPKTAVLRQLVDASYDHRFDHKPHCASGDTCRCPHAFQYAANG